MKCHRYFQFILLIGLAFLLLSPANAQETPETPAANTAKQPDFRANALQQLGLSREQILRIRRLNQERKPRMDEAQTRLRRANRALDEAIYSDSATDAEIEDKLKEFQSAQADVARIRFVGELGVRRILTPEQLKRFRNLRLRFEQTRTNAEKPGSSDTTSRPTAVRNPQTQFVKADPKKP